jgi:hypothetical protein
VKEGSGEPVISEPYFFVDKNGDIVSEKQFIPSTGEN